VPVIVVVLVAAVAAWWFLLRATPEKTITRYWAAAKAGNEAAARALLTADTAKAADDLQKTMPTPPPGAGIGKLVLGLVPRASQYADVEVGKAKIQGDTATVPVTLNFKMPGQGGGAAPNAAQKGGGSWRQRCTAPRRSEGRRHGRRPSDRRHAQA